MRVTHQMIAGNMLTHLNTQRHRMASLQGQISSGLRITKSSEDPAAGAEVMRVQNRLQVMDQWEKNMGDGKTWLRETESGLARITDLLHKARELSIRGSNEVLNDQDRQMLATEADAVLADLMNALNGQQMDGAMFGGFETGIDPFTLDPVTGAVTYSGDSGDMQRDVGPGLTLTVNVHGNRLSNWALPNNMVTTVWQLAQDLRTTQGALPATAMAANTANVDAALRSTLALRAEVGSQEQRLEQMEMQHKQASVRLSQMLEQTQSVDMEKAIMDLNSAETTYRAALQVGARIIPPTLVDFLR